MPSSAYTCCSVSHRCVSPVMSSSTPYSETCRPLRTAAARSAMLCCLEPVKCCSRLPNCSGATIRTATSRPGWGRSRTASWAGGPDELQGGGGGGQRERIVCGGDHVEVLDRVGHPSRRPGQLDPLGGRV